MEYRPLEGLRLRGLAVQLHRDRRQPDDRAGADGQHRDLEAGVERDAERLLHAARLLEAAGLPPGVINFVPGDARRDQQPAARFARARRHPLHRQHRSLQQHVEEDRREHRPLPRLSASRRRNRRQGLHRRRIRRPIRRKWRSRSCAADSSTRDRSARRRAASTCRSRSGTTSAIASSR